MYTPSLERRSNICFSTTSVKSKLSHVLKCQKFYLCKNINLWGGIFFNTPPHSMVPIHWGRNEPFFATRTTHSKRIIISKLPIQTHLIRNLTTFKHLSMHMCLHLVVLWLNPPASATSLKHNWPLEVILTYEQICWMLSTIIMIPPYPFNLQKLQYLLPPGSMPPWYILLIGL